MKIFDHLHEHSVSFVIIGGHAVNFHGYIRATEDADIIIEKTPENEENLLRALTEIHAHWITDTIDKKTGIEKTAAVTASYIQANHLMMLTTDIGYLDIFDYIPGFPQTPVRDVFNDCEHYNQLKIISLKWLRKIKEVSARPRDMDDLDNLDNL